MSSNSAPQEIDSWKILLTSIFSVSVATVAVILRIVSRRLSATSCWWDDWCIIASVIVLWASGDIQWISLGNLHFGRHVADLSTEQLAPFYKAFVGMQILYFLSAALTQVSIVLLFHRIFGHHRRFRLALASTAFVIVSFWGSYTISAFLGCRPLGSMSESCVDFLPFMRISAALSFILNLIIFVLPIPVVWSLEITTRQKFEALTVTSAGLLVSIASIMRVVSFMNADTVDLTFSGVAPMSWCSIEQGALIVCASLPVLRPLLRCCRSRSSQDSQESITSFGLQPVHESMAGDIESLNVHAKSTTSTATSSRRDTIVQDNGKGWPKPAQVGVALSPVEQDATVIFHDHPICAAILASGSSNDIFCNNMMADQRGPSLTPEIAAFRQQTRGLGHSKSNFF